MGYVAATPTLEALAWSINESTLFQGMFSMGDCATVFQVYIWQPLVDPSFQSMATLRGR